MIQFHHSAGTGLGSGQMYTDRMAMQSIYPGMLDAHLIQTRMNIPFLSSGADPSFQVWWNNQRFSSISIGQGQIFLGATLGVAKRHYDAGELKDAFAISVDVGRAALIQKEYGVMDQAFELSIDSVRARRNKGEVEEARVMIHDLAQSVSIARDAIQISENGEIARKGHKIHRVNDFLIRCGNFMSQSGFGKEALDLGMSIRRTAIGKKDVPLRMEVERHLFGWAVKFRRNVYDLSLDVDLSVIKGNVRWLVRTFNLLGRKEGAAVSLRIEGKRELDSALKRLEERLFPILKGGEQERSELWKIHAQFKSAFGTYQRARALFKEGGVARVPQGFGKEEKMAKTATAIIEKIIDRLGTMQDDIKYLRGLWGRKDSGVDYADRVTMLLENSAAGLLSRMKIVKPLVSVKLQKELLEAAIRALNASRTLRIEVLEQSFLADPSWQPIPGHDYHARYELRGAVRLVSLQESARVYLAELEEDGAHRP
ncbi:MAG: hypothetical protein HN337_06605 [Deltaproteobacteria bacterium]|jgi:hypothetical protein|nr:hypothetical protein [Deltaproteobacteria bacterium]